MSRPRATDLKGKAPVRARRFWRRRVYRTALAFARGMRARSQAECHWENGVAQRRRAHFIESTNARARSQNLSRDSSKKDSRTAIHCRSRAERDNVAAHFARGRSGASRAVDLGSNVAFAAD